VATVGGALGAGVWLAQKGAGPDRRNLDALVTVGGDLQRDLLAPALDLTRMTPGEEAALGAAIDREVRASLRVGGAARDEVYIGRVLRTMTPHVGRGGIPYKIAVVRSREVNAFAVPGGRIYVTEGLLDFVESEAELAAVLGHEVSHVDLRHCVERLQLGRAAGKVAPGLGGLARLGYEVMLRGFSEEQELAADRSGAVLSAAGGYDPWASRALFGRLARMDGGGRRPTRDPVAEVAATIPEAFRRYVATHPPADQREEAVTRRLLAEPSLWRGRRLYLGRSNHADRREMSEAPRDVEWIAREEPPI
jgi:predicted Zn-dependent protease